MSASPNELSFLPEDYLERKLRQRASVACLVLAGLVLCGIAATWSWARGKNAKLESRYAGVEARYTEAAKKIEQVKKMNEQQGQVVRHAELTASLFEKVPRSNVLAELTNALPGGCSLLEVSMASTPHRDTDAPAATSFEKHLADQQGKDALGLNAKPLKYDVTLKVSGLAQTDVQVAQLISKLSHSRLFSDVNLVISDTFEPQRSDGQKENRAEPLRKWQIEMSLNPQAEVRDDTKTAAIEMSR